MKTRSKATLTLRAMLARRYGFGASPNKPPLCHLWPQRHCLPLSGTPENSAKKQRFLLICTPFTGHPVEGVLLCGTHMSTKGNV